MKGWKLFQWLRWVLLALVLYVTSYYFRYHVDFVSSKFPVYHNGDPFICSCGYTSIWCKFLAPAEQVFYAPCQSVRRAMSPYKPDPNRVVLFMYPPPSCQSLTPAQLREDLECAGLGSNFTLIFNTPGGIGVAGDREVVAAVEAYWTERGEAEMRRLNRQ